MEVIVGLVAEKIVAALGSEAVNAVGYVLKGQRLQLSEVNEMIRRIRSEFEHMRTFISTVDLQKYIITIEPWMKRAREIADSMEDVIDQYLYLCAEQSHAATLYYYKIPFDSCYILSSNPWSDIDTRLKTIESALAHLMEMKQRYDITKLQDSEAGSSTKPEDAAGSSATYDVDARMEVEDSDTSLADDEVLFPKEKQSLIDWLNENRAERAVIVIWGMGGLGKTTLVENVYYSEELENLFDCKAWVTVSNNGNEYDLNEILRRLLNELNPYFDNNIKLARSSLIELVQYYLQEEKYLLVLDDVWTASVFTDLKNIIPNDPLGSRVVITTRHQEIAVSLASENRHIALSQLDMNQAWDLFCREAFKETRKCPTDLKNIGEQIVEKCDGLPLAIVAISRVMSLKGKTTAEWQRVLDKLSWEFSNNRSLESVKHVLNLSFDDFPSYLKNCFLYCSVFPDKLIERNKLIKLWVAESFIQDRGSQTREEVAEDFFDELVHRSMLHVVERNRYGKARRCTIHSVVRDNILSTARKEMFSIVWKESEQSQLGENARRLSVHNCATRQSILFKMDFSRIRSLFIFDYNSSTDKLFNSVSSTARYLRVIDLEKAEISKIPSALTGLFNLHYLGLKGTKVKRLPRSMAKLRNLQTVDVRDTNVEKLPKGVNQLKNLRHLLTKVNNESRQGTMHSYRFVRSLQGVWNLRSLRQLSMAVDDVTVSRLGNLTALRVLKVSNVRQSHYGNLRISLLQMPSLNQLSIIAADESEMLRLLELDPVFKKLEKLHLHGRFAEPVLPAPETTGLKLLFSRITLGRGSATPPPSVSSEVMQQMGIFNSKDYNLQGLSLSWSGLKVDPLPMISSLRKLKVLKMQNTSDTVELRFGEGCFPELKELHLLHFKHLNKINVEDGALKSLEVWAMIGLSKLMLLPKGIDSLRALDRLIVSECNPLFLYDIQRDHKRSVDHIKRIEHKYEVDGKWIIEPVTRIIEAVTRPSEAQPSQQQRATESLTRPSNASQPQILHDLDRIKTVPDTVWEPLDEEVNESGKRNSVFCIEDPISPPQNSCTQADRHEEALLSDILSSPLHSTDEGRKCLVDPMLDEQQNDVI